jgi:hypothetical protein
MEHMVGTYKNYTIKSFPLQLVNTGLWKTHIAILWERDGICNSRSFSGDTSHPTEDEAHLDGISFGQLIIDRKVPDLWLD